MNAPALGSAMGSLGIVGDIGGTNCRFALVERNSTSLISPDRFACADFPDVYGAIEAYLRRHAPGRKLDWAVIAVAGPVENNTVSMTNLAWEISGARIASQFGVADVRLVNDFSALAAASQFIKPKDLIPLGGGASRANGQVMTWAVIGPGTGLGVGGLVKKGATSIVLTTEGGHSTFAPVDDLEREIMGVLLTRFERVSNERLLCGEGLCNIHWALSKLEGVEPETLAPQDISRRAADKSDPRSVRALAVFSHALGSFGGDVVLTMGASGGLYVAGGMAPRIRGVIDIAAFRERFEAKGRFRRYMEETPVWIVNDPFAALLGAGSLAERSVGVDAAPGLSPS